MKNIYFLIVLLTISTSIVRAQSPIAVTVTGTCSPVSGEFYYDGTLNDKNHYTREYTDGTGTFYFHVSYDNTQWVLYVDDAIDEMAFYNPYIPAETLPPNTGWVADICSDGTMFIEGGINLGVNSLFLSKNLSINVNTDNFLKITFSKALQSKVDVKIFNLFGQKLVFKIIKPNTSTYELNLNHLDRGLYIVSILNTSKKVLIR